MNGDRKNKKNGKKMGWKKKKKTIEMVHGGIDRLTLSG
jgi:hypothetical protein